MRRQVGAVIGDNAAQVAIRDNERLYMVCMLAGFNCVVQFCKAVSPFKGDMKILLNGLQHFCNGRGYAFCIIKILICLEKTDRTAVPFFGFNQIVIATAQHMFIFLQKRYQIVRTREKRSLPSFQFFRIFN